MEEFIASMTPEEKSKQVFVFVADESAGRSIETYRIERDVYLYDDDPEDSYDSLEQFREMNEDTEGVDESKLILVTPKGTPFLSAYDKEG